MRRGPGFGDGVDEFPVAWCMNDINNLDLDLLPDGRPETTVPAGRNGWHGHAHSETGRMSERPQSETRARREPAPVPFDPLCLVEILLQRWRWLLLGGCAFAFLGMIAGLICWKQSYTAVALLMRYEPMASGDFFKPQPLTPDTFAGLLKAPELLQRVGSRIHPPVSQEALAKYVFIKTDPDSDLVKVGVKGRNAQAVVDLANFYSREAVNYTLDLQRREAEEVNKNYLQQRLDGMDGNIQSLETEFRQLPEGAQLRSKLKQIGGTVTNLSRQLQSSSRPSAAAAKMTERLQTALDELGNLTKRYTDAHPLVQQQRSYIKEIQEQLAQASHNPPASSDVGEFPVAPITTQMFEPDYEIIRGKLQALDNSRQLLADREQEALSFAANPPGFVRFFAPATMRGIVADRRWLKVGFLAIGGGVLGMLFAAAGVLLVEFVDNRLKTTADVQRVTRLSVLATLGDLSDKGPSAREKWAFRTWTMLQGRLSPSANHGLVCGITSSQPGEGRSTWIHLLAEAASMAGFRVLTIATRPPVTEAKIKGEITGPNREESMEERNLNALTTNALACPAEVTRQLTGPDPQPSIHIPLPGWVWNLERRKQWQEALKHWRTIDNLVILVELPPASIPEAVLLGENVPNLIWLTGSGLADAAETRAQLETLRHARCHLVGAVLNREPAPSLKSRFPRWLSCLAFCFALGMASARGADTNLVTTPPSTPITPIQEQSTATAAPAAASPSIPITPNPANFSFSLINPANRGEWQKHLTLGAGDVLNFYLYGEPDVSHQGVFVGPDGRVSFLEAQNIMAAGLTVDELRTNLDLELAKYRRAPRTIIMPVAYNSKKYYVLGMVVQRGVYLLNRPLTVVEAVARAHGLETGVSDRDTVELADFQRSFLMRRGKRIPLDFEKLFKRGDLSQNIAIEPDDYLYFPPGNLKQLYVLGEVRSPGMVSYTPEMTAVQAITMRGGFTDAAYKTHVIVIRGSFNHPKTFVVNTWAVFDARGQDFKMEPKDIIYVSGRPFLRAEELLDLAATAFIQSVTAEWAGVHIGSFIPAGSIPGP